MSNRDRAWRRFQKYNKGHTANITDIFKPEKNWKLMYTRSDKIQRAKQLGIEYPKRTLDQILNDYN